MALQRWVRAVSVSTPGAVKAALLTLARGGGGGGGGAQAPAVRLASARVWHAWIDAAEAMREDR